MLRISQRFKHLEHHFILERISALINKGESSGVNLPTNSIVDPIGGGYDKSRVWINCNYSFSGGIMSSWR